MKEIDRADLAAPDKDSGQRSLFPFVHVERNWDKLPDPPKETPAPEIGTKKAFVPSYMLMESGYQYAVKGTEDFTVWGEVVQVSEAGRWYRVRYTMPDGSEAFECFKY